MHSLRIRFTVVLMLALGTLTASPALAVSKPPAPAGVKVMPTQDAVTVTWKASARATSYSVCLMSHGKTSHCTHAARRVRGTSATIEGLKPTTGTDWFVRVRSNNSAGYSDAPKIAMNLTAKPVRPPAPTGVIVRPTENSATVTWTKSAGATSYSVCLMSHGKTSHCTHAARRVRGTSATIEGLKPTTGTDWFVRVRSNNSAGYSDAPKIAMNLLEPPPLQRPPAPANVKVAPTQDAVTVTWDPSARATSYSVCLFSSGTATSCSYTARRLRVPTATIEGLVPTGGTDYYVRVRSNNSAGYSDAAKVAMNLQAAPTKPPAPKNVVVEPSYNSVTVTWQPSAGATSYSVCLMTNGETSYCTYAARRLQEPTATIEGLVPTGGTDYYVRVRANNSHGYSDAPKIAMNLKTDDRVGSGADVTVMTYNLCGQDKCLTSSNKMKPWSTRKPLAGAWARIGKADIIATQESHSRDTQFETELPGFAVAAYYSAKTLFYDTSRFVVADAGVITLDDKERKYAVWAEFKDMNTATRFIVADAHLQPYKGKRYDDMRYAQTNVLLDEVANENPDGLPVVYAGDFNSNDSNAKSKYPGGYDAPLKAFDEAGIPDAITAGPDSRRYRADWNSANQAKNPPLRHGDHVDHIYVDPQVRVNEWMMMVRGTAGNYITPFATDHNPIRVKLSIPGE